MDILAANSIVMDVREYFECVPLKNPQERETSPVFMSKSEIPLARKSVDMSHTKQMP